MFAIKFQANIHFQTKTKKESNNNNVMIIAIIKQKTKKNNNQTLRGNKVIINFI